MPTTTFDYKVRDVEVLLLTDPVDSFWVRTALGFDGKPFKSRIHKCPPWLNVLKSGGACSEHRTPIPATNSPCRC